ncbi:PREDICTED: striatin-3-like isoform X2 [Priapulus caudatus]|uniref:Striatin-3-like isoform X2 n=1 Tax=Priapulus caudatus TaxID=37621 RepID=A0ABM1E2N5_PRICU|nr:PREDICTED: striatin-3-like isoform X2 [Priapulus caudatus]
MVEEGPAGNTQISNGPNSQAGPSITGFGVKGVDDQVPRTLPYSIPGILHFIQHEWARFEMERSQWEVEKAELQARIAFLQGERQGQENLKRDLVRRIKMLEYALKQERARFHKLKYGADMLPDNKELEEAEDLNGDNYLTGVENHSWKQGRQLLRQYLQEIGYTDTIIDVRSARVRQLLGLSPNNNDLGKELATLPAVNGDQTTKRVSDGQGRRVQAKKHPATLGEGALLESEAAVIDTFSFLSTENDLEVEDDEENEADLIDETLADELDRIDVKKPKPKGMTRSNEGMARMDDVLANETEEALSQFDFLGSDGADGAGEARTQGDGTEWGPKRSTLQAMLASLGGNDDIGLPSVTAPCAGPAPAAAAAAAATASDSLSNSLPADDTAVDEAAGPNDANIPFPAGPRRPLPAEEGFEPGFGLGELAGLTIQNDCELSYDLSSSKDALRKTWNAKYTLRSHFDGIRALVFHPVDPVLITASEDHTLKLWNLDKTVPAKKTASLDVEPVYTFRGHTGAVLSLAMSVSGEECFSGGIDSSIRCWKIPSSNVDPYDMYDPSVLAATLTGHTGAVWGLSVHSSNNRLLSCASDGTVRLWQPYTKEPLLKTFTSENGLIPTSIDFVRSDPIQMVAAYSDCDAVIYDLETSQPVIHLESKDLSEPGVLSTIHQVVSHPTLPITVTAHEDRHIRFFDNNTGKMVHTMVAHLDAVTSLAIDPNGLYLLSGSHDCSIRLWNLDSKTCVQEITSHRKKFDESIYDVAFHPSRPYIASAGADALAKVFV